MSMFQIGQKVSVSAESARIIGFTDDGFVAILRVTDATTTRTARVPVGWLTAEAGVGTTEAELVAAEIAS